MLERRRKNKHYDIVPGDEADLEEGHEEDRDVELGTVRDQETGVKSGESAQAGAGATNVTEELDNWDENAEDWDEEPSTASGDGVKTPSTDDEPKKRTD